MIGISTYLSIITLNIKSLNSTSKRCSSNDLWSAENSIDQQRHTQTTYSKQIESEIKEE
jgi:hypothetical protein